MILLLLIQGLVMCNSSDSANGGDFKALKPVVLAQITAEERKNSVVYLDERVRPAGKVKCGATEVQVEHPHVLAFIDLQPGANWMHPYRYLLIDPTSRRVTAVPGDRPPVFGTLPPTWRVVSRPPGLPDWRLLPGSQTSPKS